MDVAFLDGGGFSDEQKKLLAGLGVRLVDPGWPSKAVEKRAKGKDFLKINLAKPCLNQYFPAHDIVIWIDGDAWLQNWKAIEIATEVAQKGKLAIVSESSRLRGRQFIFRKKMFGWVELRTIFYKNAKRAGLTSSDQWFLANKGVLNAGFYALRQDSPHWDVWSARREGLSKGRLFTSDQLSLALAVYRDGIPYEALPEYCNYMGPWRMGKDNKLVELYVPYNEVSLVHMQSLDEQRKDPKVYLSMVTEDDSVKEMPIRYCELKK